MAITIIICTWNRPQILRNCLFSLTEILVPDGLQWEILVVINGSSDKVIQVLEEFQDTLPIRMVFEPRLGLSRARNTGIDSALGDLIIFFDDDVLVDSLYLENLCKAKSSFPEGALFGGRIDPILELKSPEKYLFLKAPFFDGLILRKNLDSACRVMFTNEYFFGANFAVKKEVFQQLRFDERLGKKGAQQLLGEEIRLQDEAIQKGLIRIWVSNAKVSHRISAKRLDFKYLCSYFWGLGRTHYKLKKTLLFPRLESIAFVGCVAQISFSAGCLYEFLIGFLLNNHLYVKLNTSHSR
ncbi:MAG: glycosyltransferase family 2 protein [Proteobacteria bacterium]|nr:glycosyltransferase family 2 protein [Pseudomonadota bacterium]